MDIILIEGLRVVCIVGMFSHEREYPQLLRVDARIMIPQVWHQDELSHSIDYSKVCQWIERYIQEQRFQTLENAAQSIITEMFSVWDRIAEIELTLRKPSAIPQADCVGFCMRRQRS